MANLIRIIVCVFAVALRASGQIAANDAKVKVGFLGEGESVTLTCDLPFSKPKAQVTWSDLVTNDNENEPELIYDGKNIVSGHMFSSHFSVSADQRSLTIANPSSDMTGEYICLSRINNTYTARRSYRLDLVERAKCKTEGGTDLMEGQRTTVYCTSSYSGYHVPVLRWTRNGQPVESTHKAPTAVAESLDMSEAYQGIDIEATGDDDKAEYACHMDVPDQTPIECKVILNVKHSLRNVDIKPPSGDIHANDYVTCTGRANPPAQVTLKVNVEGVAEVKAMSSASLKIQPAWVGRFILIDCTATADKGAHKHSLDTTTSYTVLAPRPDPQSATAGVTDPTMIIIVFVIIALVVAVIVIVAVVCVIKKKQSMNKKVSKEKSTREEEKKLYHDEPRA